ncbi:hypothetical protein PJK45_28095 [Mycobacterium kansasii]
MGLDSTCLLLRWLEEPSSRDFELTDLVLVTAFTGNEFETTRRVVERHVLPRLRDNGVRFVQCARSRRLTTTRGDGVVVLDDSTTPQRLHFRGRYRLSDEMLSQGTIPQLGGFRSCSVHSKANALEPVIAALTQGQPYRHAIGFEVGERARASKDSLYNNARRTGWYPLVEWGFDRAKAQEYVTAVTGEPFPKSACSYCCFAMATQKGRANQIERYRSEPQAGAQALLLETVARSLNPRQTLIAGSSAADLVADARLTDVLDEFANLLEQATFAVYEVRRVKIQVGEARRTMTARSVRAIARGSLAAMNDYLAMLPGHREIGPDAIVRHYIDSAERCEHLFVVAPAVVKDKQRPQFERMWQEANSEKLF